MTPEGFEPALPARDRPRSHTLDCEATGTGLVLCSAVNVPLMVMLFI
jgi:hypothetical protein